MSQDTLTTDTPETSEGDEHSHSGTLLGPLLCWAVVFADIGTSIYYVPGILYGNVGNLAGFFVFLTMSVFVLLTLKYAEVTHRFPQGGGVVTVAASAFNKWFGALGGMFILVDYFLTSSISSLSGMQYLSVVIPALGESAKLPGVGSVQVMLLLITIGVLVLLGILNWYGVSESAKVSLVGAIIAFVSDLAILVTVFSHISFSEFLSLFPRMFTGHPLTFESLLIGFAGSFLAFSGLESISQLSPVMKTPRKRVAGIALLLVIITIGLTSPFLTMFSTLLQPREASDSILSAQLISLLAGHWGSVFLQTEVAISASALLVFASNTAIIGAYHVFIALARLGFFPAFVLKRNRIRETPHYSIMLATGIPIVILIIVLGNITILGDMYAFGLLGAFTLTCLGLDIIRARDRKAVQLRTERRTNPGDNLAVLDTTQAHSVSEDEEREDDVRRNGHYSMNGRNGRHGTQPEAPARSRFVVIVGALWRRLDFWLGILTTLLVMIAWSTNLVAKPLATLFGGAVTIIGMTISYFNYRTEERKGQAPVHIVPLSSVQLLSNALLAVLMPGEDKANKAVVQSAAHHTDGQQVAFLYIGRPKDVPTLSPFEYYDPYLYDETALQTFRKAAAFMREKKLSVQPQFVYRPIPQGAKPQEAEILTYIWQTMHPHELLVSADDLKKINDINPDRIRYELTSNGKVAHLLARR
ncbi:MAG: APC family permease [Ktedonobacteraceae bacterium]|nr:APC family permease [Ktedonobacteraceae bacterium]